MIARGGFAPPRAGIEGEVTRLTCPSCKLSIAVRGPADVMEHCPRCLARARRAVRLIATERPAPRCAAGQETPGAGLAMSEGG